MSNEYIRRSVSSSPNTQASTSTVAQSQPCHRRSPSLSRLAPVNQHRLDFATNFDFDWISEAAAVADGLTAVMGDIASTTAELQRNPITVTGAPVVAAVFTTMDQSQSGVMDPKKRKDAPGSNNPDTKKLKLDDSLDEFSAVRDLDEGFLNDPSLKESVTQVLSDPAYRQMSQQLEYLLTASTHPQYNEEAYLSAACRVFGNDQLSAFMRHIGQAVDEDLSKPNPKLRLVPALKTIHDKVVAGGRPAFIRYWTDREALAELVGAIKLSITANCPNSVEKPEAEEPAYKDEPVLHRYARAGDIISLEEALKSGADKNILDIYGGTALHAACAYGQDKCVEILLKYGYAVTAVDSHKHTPLHLAVFHGFPLCVNSLLNYGAHVTIWLKNDEGESPMDFAVDDDLNRNDVLKMLLKKLESVSVATG